MSDEPIEQLGIVHHRRPANWVGAWLLVAIGALGTMVVTVPPAPLLSATTAAPAAIGGGPIANSEEESGVMVCWTADGAPYNAVSCPATP
jgi:hypothetical protein